MVNQKLDNSGPNGPPRTAAESNGPMTTSAATAPLLEHSAHHSRDQFLKLALGALGVVYGDIGTSPLYALRECFHELGVTEPVVGVANAAAAASHVVSHDEVLCILSLAT